MFSHPSLNLLGFDFSTSYTEFETTLTCVDKVPLLAMSYDGLHFFWFDVLVELPLGQTRSVLANPVLLVSSITTEQHGAQYTQQ